MDVDAEADAAPSHPPPLSSTSPGLPFPGKLVGGVREVAHQHM
jgi:hypothetical protein